MIRCIRKEMGCYHVCVWIYLLHKNSINYYFVFCWSLLKWPIKEWCASKWSYVELETGLKIIL